MKLNERVEDWFGMEQANGNFDTYAGKPAALSKRSYERGFIDGVTEALRAVRRGDTTWETIQAIIDLGNKDVAE